jgi:hypothetical protein
MSPVWVTALRNHRHDRYYVRYEVSRVMTGWDGVFVLT